MNFRNDDDFVAPEFHNCKNRPRRATSDQPWPDRAENRVEILISTFPWAHVRHTHAY